MWPASFHEETTWDELSYMTCLGSFALPFTDRHKYNIGSKLMMNPIKLVALLPSKSYR